MSVLDRNQRLHTILIPKATFTEREATEWIKKHGYDHTRKRKQDNYYRYRQLSPEYLRRTGFTEYRTINLPNNIQIILAYKPRS